MPSKTQPLNLILSVLSLLLVLLAVACRAVELPTLDASVLESVDVDQLKASYLPEGLRNTNVTLDDLHRLLESKCRRANKQQQEVNATALSKAIETAAGVLVECLSGLANMTEIQAEIAEASPKGDLDVVFEKYCLRMPRAKACLKDFNDALLPCLNSEERAHNAVLQRIADRLLEFICYKNGDQIALFIAEQGPECLEQSREGIANCLNSTFGGYLPKHLTPDWTSGEGLPELVLGPRQCVDLYDFETCTVQLLERCEVITPSNIVESMFRYVRRESSCQPSIDKAMAQRRTALPLVAAKDGASGLSSAWTLSSLLLLSGLVLARL
ncbi:hypothetical protein KR054_002403 [Drosophila jambulina]|nr:hypothetical protein KR054_002403 [Drosophila jambulina]